jgi:site-specific DNA recombinase
MEDKMDKAALYLRLSKEDVDKINKGDDSESIVNQRLLLTDYAVSHDMQIVDVYSDDDYSGLYDDRPEFDRLIKDAKLGKYNVVIAKTQSRFTRNMEHMEKYLHHDFPLLGIRFIGVIDGVDTLNANNKKSRQINGLVNEWYCEDLSNNIRSVFKQKMKAGQFLGSFAPYGYEKDPDDKHKFIIDEYAANVVRKIYDLYLQGYSTKAISHMLEDEHIDNPTVYKQKKGLQYQNRQADEFSIKYNFWSITTINRILRNETYIGKLEQGTCEKVSYKDKKVVALPKEKWIVIDNHHEAIIDKELFYKVQKMRKSRRIVNVNQESGKKTHVFSGKLKCATCGHTMIKSGIVRGTNNDWYMRCQLANKSRGKECTSHNIRYSKIYEIVLKRIKAIVRSVLESNGNTEKLAAELMLNDNKKQIQQYRKEQQKAEAHINEITQSLKLLYQDRVNKAISDEMFFKLKENFDNELVELQKTSLETVQKIQKIEELIQSKDSIIQSVQRYADFSELTHEIVNDFIDYIEIDERKQNDSSEEQRIIIHWNF